jgi:hypothetical protein
MRYVELIEEDITEQQVFEAYLNRVTTQFAEGLDPAVIFDTLGEELLEHGIDHDDVVGILQDILEAANSDEDLDEWIPTKKMCKSGKKLPNSAKSSCKAQGYMRRTDRTHDKIDGKPIYGTYRRHRKYGGDLHSPA